MSELNEVIKGIFDKLTDEQKEKAKACKNADELMKFFGREGIELPDEMMDIVAGGVSMIEEMTKYFTKEGSSYIEEHMAGQQSL